jgi:peptide/nickel transport system permease protein
MKLRHYVLRRLFYIIPVLVGISILTFVVSHLIPGDPISLAAGPQATPEMIENLRRQFGMDKPLWQQYFLYIANLLRGDWGMSMLSRRPVLQELKAYLPATLELVLTATFLAVILGIPMGIAAAVFRDRWPDQGSRLFSLSAVSIPSFWLAILFQLALGLYLGLFPIGGRLDTMLEPPKTITGMIVVDSILTLNKETLVNALRHLVLPAVTLCIPSLATITRMMRAGVLEVMHEDHVRMQRASGLPERVVFFKYVLKIALISTVTMIGLQFGWQMAGSVLIETVYDWPGVGLYAMKSAMSLDFQPIMGIALMYGVIFALVNILVDVTYGFLDPRIRYE